MKKVLSIVLALVLVLGLVACGGGGEDTNTDATYKLGLGVSMSLKATDASEDADGNAQQDGTAAAVILDAEGKIVACKIDVAQNKMAFTATGEVLNKDTEFVTKKVKEFDYGMAPVSTLEEGEWFQQIAKFEEYVIGMTADEVAAIETVLSNGHMVPVDEALLAGCTMQITDFQAAVVDACNKAVDCGAGSNLALGIVSDMASSTDASEDADGVAFSTSTYAAYATDDEGVITGAYIDCTQAKIAITADGKGIAPESVTTKKDLKEAYGMQVASPLEEGEWYQQIAAFEAYIVGMTADEVGAMELVESNGHMVSTDEALLAGCTMDISDFVAAVAAAI